MERVPRLRISYDDPNKFQQEDNKINSTGKAGQQQTAPVFQLHRTHVPPSNKHGLGRTDDEFGPVGSATGGTCPRRFEKRGSSSSSSSRSLVVTFSRSGRTTIPSPPRAWTMTAAAMMMIDRRSSLSFS
jgi:hypothetical protein